MKLARPEVFHPRIVLAGSPDGDDADLVGALRTRGLHAKWLPWTDPGTLDANLVILREGSDHADFLAWTTQVPNLLNAPDVVAWNAGRHHLRDVRDAGLGVAGRQRTCTALVFLGGLHSHAFVGGSAVDADFELWDRGRAALQAVADRIGITVDQLLYARVDVTGDAKVVDVNLIAPQLGWRSLDAPAREEALRRFALCVESALERLGLGPLSHRGP